MREKRRNPTGGGPERTRTSDTRFRKPLLYPLSYGGGDRDVGRDQWTGGGPGPGDQPAEFLAAVTGFQIRDSDTYEVIAELPASARSWDPWPHALQTVDPDDCGYYDVAATSAQGVIGSSYATICRF